MRGQAAAGQVGLGPCQQVFKARAIVVGQGEEQRVRLALRRGAVGTVVVDDPTLRVDEMRGISVPQRPRTLLATAAGAQKEEQEDEDQTPP